MSDLQIQIEEIPQLDHTCLVVLRGSIDAKTVFAFQSKLTASMERGIRRFIVDMEGVKYVNSTGLGYLINLSDSIGAESGEVCLVHIQPKVKMVFDMLGLNEFFKAYASREEAVRQMGHTPAAEEMSPAPSAQSGAQTVILRVARPEPKPEAPAAPPPKPAPPPPPAKTVQDTVGARPPAPKPGSGEETDRSRPPAPGEQTLPCPTCTSPLLLKEAGAYRCPRCFSAFQFSGAAIGQVVPKGRATTMQLSIDCGAESIEGLLGFVEALARKTGFSDVGRGRLREVVRSCVEDVRLHSYNGQDDRMLHVLMVSSEDQLELRLADTGKTIERAADGEGPFKLARQYLDKFSQSAHPRGGNVLTLVKKKA